MSNTDEIEAGIQACIPASAEATTLLGEFQFLVDVGKSVTVHVRLWRDAGSDKQFGTSGVRYEVSHYPAVPPSAGRYSPSRPYAANIAEAVRKAYDLVVGSVDHGKASGHTPSESWLEPNPYF